MGVWTLPPPRSSKKPLLHPITHILVADCHHNHPSLHQGGVFGSIFFKKAKKATTKKIIGEHRRGGGQQPRGQSVAFRLVGQPFSDPNLFRPTSQQNTHSNALWGKCCCSHTNPKTVRSTKIKMLSLERNDQEMVIMAKLKM